MVQNIQPASVSEPLGFTLLEVIISMALTSTLMLVLWSLFSTYTKLEERSRQAATEFQLVRSLSRQLRSDLDHFAVLAIPPNIIPQVTAKALDDEDAAENLSSDAIEGDVLAAPDSQSMESNTVDEGALANSPTVFNASLPEQTYLRGLAKKLELVTRLPYTVNVPTGQQRLGAETRYGTYQLVVYEFRDARDLKSLLTSDPVLNPTLFQPPLPQAPTDPNRAPPPMAQPLNPNDSVGLMRETKSWLQVARDRRRDAIFKQAEAAGLLVNGQLPPADQPRDLQSELQSKVNTVRQSVNPLAENAQSQWTPPPELKAKRDDLPEVTRLQFRYFDGSSWLLEWSGEEGRLPHAIEVAFDLDPDAPAVRAKEFAEAHELVVDGATIDEVLPEEDLKVLDFEDQQDPLTRLNLEDPTAIVTEYRFVIALSQGSTTSAEDEDEDEEVLAQTAAAIK